MIRSAANHPKSRENQKLSSNMIKIENTTGRVHGRVLLRIFIGCGACCQLGSLLLFLFVTLYLRCVLVAAVLGRVESWVRVRALGFPLPSLSPDPRRNY